MTVRLDTRLFTLAKDPEQPGAFQDACCIDTEHHMAAIADGVSSALFSGPWAAILAEAVVADCPNPTEAEAFAAWLARQRERWAASVDTSGLSWFQKAKLPMGAFSTLLFTRVCQIDDAPAGAFGGFRLVAFALGDSCLFQVRGGELVRSFPLETAEQFETDPIVLGSVDLKRDHLLQFAFLDEMCYAGDELILCTDAVAEWAVRVLCQRRAAGLERFLGHVRRRLAIGRRLAQAGAADAHRRLDDAHAPRGRRVRGNACRRTRTARSRRLKPQAPLQPTTPRTWIGSRRLRRT